MSFAPKHWLVLVLSMPIEFIEEARAEFDNAFLWYKARSNLAAIRFTIELDAAIQKISVDPERFPRTHQTV